MFTGIIEEIGRIKSIDMIAGTMRMQIAAKDILNGMRIGDSVAVSGVCLTAIDLHEYGFSADLAAETWERTSFSRLETGSAINLELPMKASGRFGGHLVQGHVEGTGEFRSLSPVPGAQDFWLQIEVPPEIKRSVVSKGSIAIEGISLTVAKLTGNVVTVAIIPHTWKSTNLPFLNPGDPVNIETDVMSSYLAKWSAEERADAPQGITPSASENRFRYAVVVSEFNSFITDQLLSGALQTLKSHQVALSDITVVHVPGAYEIPVTASLLAKSGQFDAIICLGCLIRGGTLHFEVIAHESSRGIGQSALESGVPHSFGVITCDTQEQAIDRAGLKAGNKGSEAALAAIRMARINNELVSDEAVTQRSPLPCNSLPPDNRKTAAHRAQTSVHPVQRGGEPL
jgi:riboflavin synthase alpha subunit/6,7-dimethyl-8-ribityllumazine synthase